jgi:cytochrome c oxidase assembly factor CtaG
MAFGDLIGTIYDFLLQFMPVFRVFWVVSILVGAVLVVSAAILKKNPERKKAPWILGVVAILMIASSGAQLLSSLI